MSIVGRQIELGVATEATRGTAETTADRWIRAVNANIVERGAHADDDTTRGVLEDGEGRRLVQKFIEGELEGILHPDLFSWFMANIYGLAVTTDLTGGAYQHVFNVKQDIQHQSLSLFAKDGDVQQLVFDTCMIENLEISAAIDQQVRFNASFIGGASASNSDAPSYDTEYDFVAKDITVKFATSEAGLSGATAVKVKDLSFGYNQGLVRDHVVGAYEPDDVYNGRLMIEGQFTLNYEDNTYKDLYLSDNARYMQISIVGTEDIGSGENPTFELLLNKTQVMDWNRSGDANELVTQPISFKAMYNASDSKASQTTLKNQVTSIPNVPAS